MILLNISFFTASALSDLRYPSKEMTRFSFSKVKFIVTIFCFLYNTSNLRCKSIKKQANKQQFDEKSYHLLAFCCATLRTLNCSSGQCGTKLRAKWYKVPGKAVQRCGHLGTKVRATPTDDSCQKGFRQLSKRFSSAVRKVFDSCQKRL